MDYHQLYAVTVKDAFPFLRVDDSLGALSGFRSFSTLDLALDYWQVVIDAGTLENSAFITLSNLYKWIMKPFGFCNAPSTFARLMELV